MNKSIFKAVFEVLAIFAAIVGAMWASDNHWLPRTEFDSAISRLDKNFIDVKDLLKKNYDESRCIQLRTQRRNVKQDLMILRLSAAGSKLNAYAVSALDGELAEIERAIATRCR